MIYTTLHNKWLRLGGGVFGELLSAIGAIYFVVPHGLYTGGLMGLCQLLRSFLMGALHTDFGGFDMAGLFYLALNIPILFLAWRSLGISLVVKTLIGTVAYSLFYSILPLPAAPVVEDILTSSLIAGIICGVGSGIALTCGITGGGLDVLGLIFSARGTRMSVGKFSLSFNAVLYAMLFFLYNVQVVIYSVIYNFINAMVIDKVHQQNVNVQTLIFTREDVGAISDFIIERIGRSATTWESTGGYTHQNVHVLCVCLSRYEVDELRAAVRELDPNAFIVVEEGVRVFGNFPKHLQ